MKFHGIDFSKELSFKNKKTDKLDDNLFAALSKPASASQISIVTLKGETHSGKTEDTLNWAKERGVYLIRINFDIYRDNILNGNVEKALDSLYSNVVTELNHSNCILFVDQVREEEQDKIKELILTLNKRLLKERTGMNRNLLFLIEAITTK